MSCTDKNVQRRRRIVAAALALPLSLGFTGTAMATASGEIAPAASLRVAADAAPGGAKAAAAQEAAAEKAELRVADDAAAKPAEKPAQAKAEAKADTKAPAKGAAAPAAAPDTFVNGNANSSKADRPTGPVAGTPSQPLSKADKNGTGANPGSTCTHAYCSNGTGLEPGNGKGDGAAVGQPCAGCVGKADNKNPKGQFPNGSDNNAGYECDRNQGIGQTNPAHTGCTGTTTPPTDACPNMPGPQAPGTNCNPGGGGGGGGDTDACPDMPGKQAPGTDCTPGGGGGGGGDTDACPDMPGNQPAGTDCVKVDKDEITICHATGSATNPFVILTIDRSGLNGHADHAGDIIPAPANGICTSGGGGGGGGGEFDNCPNMPGNQPVGTNCGGGGGGGEFDNCPNMPGNQPAGTNCGGTGGGGGSFDNCPDMPGNQAPNTVCTVGSPKPPTTPIGGVTPPQAGSNPLPGIVPNSNNGPAVISLPPTARPQARAVPSALPFTGTDAALLAELGVLLLVTGVGVVAVARRERTARAAA